MATSLYLNRFIGDEIQRQKIDLFFAAALPSMLDFPAAWAATVIRRMPNGRVERHYKDGELVMERRIPSDYLLTWFIARVDPLQFGSPTAKALAAATGDPCERARQELPGLIASFEDVPDEECPFEPIDYLDDRLGETGTGDPISDQERG